MKERKNIQKFVNLFQKYPLRQIERYKKHTPQASGVKKYFFL